MYIDVFYDCYSLTIENKYNVLDTKHLNKKFLSSGIDSLFLLNTLIGTTE